MSLDYLKGIVGFANEEVPPNQLFGSFSLYDFVPLDEARIHPHQFQIAETRKELTAIFEAFHQNPRDTEGLQKFDADITWDFGFTAFFENYGYGNRANFLDYQLHKTLYKKTFINSVRTLFSSDIWKNYREKFDPQGAKKQEVEQWLSRKTADLEAGKIKFNITHRHHALIYKYLIESKSVTLTTRKEIKDIFGSVREKAFDAVNEHSQTYNPPDAKEIESIMPFLRVFPKAEALAKQQLSILET